MVVRSIFDRVCIADHRLEERSARRRLLQDLIMEVVGEAANWSTTLAEAPVRRTGYRNPFFP